MVRSTPRQRALFADKFLDLANYAAAALVFVFAAWAFWLAGER